MTQKNISQIMFFFQIWNRFLVFLIVKKILFFNTIKAVFLGFLQIFKWKLSVVFKILTFYFVCKNCLRNNKIIDFCILISEFIVGPTKWPKGDEKLKKKKVIAKSLVKWKKTHFSCASNNSFYSFCIKVSLTAILFFKFQSKLSV